MSWVAVAIGGSAIVNGLLQSNASSNAAAAQRDAANSANQISMAQYNQTRQDQLPWMQRGNAAGNQLAYLLGLPGYGPVATPASGGNLGSYMAQAGGGNPNVATARGMMSPTGVVDRYDNSGFGDEFGSPDAPPDSFSGGGGEGRFNSGSNDGLSGFSYNPSMGAYGSLSKKFGMEDFQTDPGYQFRLSEGAKALERSAAARGMSLSGAQQKALNRYTQDFASNEYTNAYNRYNNDQTSLYNKLAGVSGNGQQTATQLGNQGMNLAQYMGNNAMGAGNASAANYIGQANAIGNALNGGLNGWMTYKMGSKQGWW